MDTNKLTLIVSLRYTCCRRLIAQAIGILIVAIYMVGCASPFDSIDQQAAKMIERRQKLVFGDDAPNDPNIVPMIGSSPGPNAKLYNPKPATISPTVDLLDVQPAERGNADGDESEIPQALGDSKDAEPMNLQQVLAYAIEYSPDYRNEKEALFLSALDLLAERHLWGPQFFHDFTATFSGTPEAGDHEQVSELVNSFGVTQRLPYGGEVSVSALVSLVNTLNEASDVSPDHGQTTGVTLAATLPLLRGAGQVAREDIIQAERNLVYSTRTFERFRRQYFVDIASTYFNLMAQKESLANLRSQVKGLQRLAERFEKLAEAGRVPFFDAEQSEARALSAVSRLSNDEQRYADSLDSFKLQIGMPMAKQIVLVPSEIMVPEPVLDRVKSVVVGRSNRLDLQTQADQLDDARRGVLIAKNQLLPQLDLFGSVGSSTDSRADEKIFDFGLGDGSYSGGLRFSSPVNRHNDFIAYRRSLINLERSNRSYTLAVDGVTLQIRSSIRQIKQARFALDLQERNVQISERRLKGVLLREDELQPRDVIEAEEDLLLSRNSRNVAIRDLRVSILQYLLDTGQMRVDTNGRWLPPGKLKILIPEDNADQKEAKEPEVEKPVPAPIEPVE